MNILSDAGVQDIDSWWRAANYLSVGQIYLQANALLREPLRAEQIKPRLLGHWGTSPGINLIYAHLNRLVRAGEKDVMLLVGPGHGGPAVLCAGDVATLETVAAAAHHALRHDRAQSNEPLSPRDRDPAPLRRNR